MKLDQNQQQELEHLKLWAADCPACREYAVWKAQYRANKDPNYWGWLPVELSVFLQQQSSTSSVKPSEQPGTDEPEPKPAGTPTTRQPASTGPRPTSLREGS